MRLAANWWPRGTPGTERSRPGWLCCPITFPACGGGRWRPSCPACPRRCGAATPTRPAPWTAWRSTPKGGDASRPERVRIRRGARPSAEPNEHGRLMVSYDPVEERAHRVGRCLHGAAEPDLTVAVIADVEEE